MLDIKTRRQHPESNGIAERFNGTVRDETSDNYGNNYLEAQATIASLVRPTTKNDCMPRWAI